MSILASVGASFAFSLTAGALSLPAQAPLNSAPIEVIHGKPFVMVMLNGKGPFRFVIDTGTGAQAMVTPELADQLGLRQAGQVRLTDPSRQGEQRTQMVSVDSLVVAGVEFTEIKAIRHALSSEDGPCQGLLGFTLFRDYLLTLDYPNRRVTLATGSLQPDRERSVLAMRVPDGVPVAALRIGDLSFEAQIDSGGDGLSLPDQLASHLKFAVGPTAFANGQSLSTRFQVKAGKLATDVHLGRYTFPRPFVEINPAFPLANLGSAAIENFALTFDQKSLLVRFDGSRSKYILSATESATRLTNAPQEKPPTPNLVPVG